MRNVKWIVLVALGALAVGLGWWWLRPDAIEGALLAEAPYRILKEHEPANYEKVLAAYRRTRAGTASREAYVTVANVEFAEAATRRFPTAPEQSVLALMRATLPVVKKLERQSPEACFSFWFPEVPGVPDMQKFVSADDQRLLLELQAEVIRGAAERPIPRPAASELDQPLSEIINSMYQRYGNDVRMLSHVEEPGVDRARVCTMITSMYESIMALPPETSGKLMRGLLARS